MKAVVFPLCGSGIVQFEIGKVGRGMAGDTIADLSSRQFSGGSDRSGWFCQKDLQSLDFGRPEFERLRVKLELAVGSVRIRSNKLRAGQPIDKRAQTPAVVQGGLIGIRLLREAVCFEEDIERRTNRGAAVFRLGEAQTVHIRGNHLHHGIEDFLIRG